MHLHRVTGATVLATMLALTAACQSSPAGGGAHDGTGKTGATANAPAGGHADGDFCTLVKAKGGADMLSIDDTSTGDTTAVVANFDEVAAAAPAEIHADFAAVDQLIHQILGPNPDPAAYAKLGEPDMVASLDRINTYLSDKCHITA
jgi:hypothetical protein